MEKRIFILLFSQNKETLNMLVSCQEVASGEEMIED
jgi:hypothetical protein